MLAWWRRRSLRTRLTASATAVLALGITSAAALLLWRVQVSLRTELDATVTNEAALIAASNVPDTGRLPAGTPAAAAIQVIGPHGEVRASSANIDGEPALFAFPPAASGRISIRTIPTTPLGDNGAYRVAALTVGRTGETVYVALPLAQAQNVMTTLLGLFVLGVPLGTGALGLVTWLLVGGALRPVETLRAQAASITATSGQRRVEVPQSADELARLAATLNALLGRLDDASDRQRQFVADAAHELRSPVTSLQTQLEVANRLTAGSDQVTVPRSLAADANRLSHLVDALLALARMDAHPTLQRHALDLDDLVHAEVASLRARTEHLLDSSGVQPVQIYGDAGLMSGVVRNLFDNADRHARRVITVSLRRVNDHAELIVADDGPGIPPADRSRVFERFTRLDQGRARDAGGAGLGLALVSTAVVAHGGQVWITDADPGAEFHVTLPVDSTEVRREARGAGPRDS